MNTQRIGGIVYLAGLAIMIGDVIYGKQIQTEVAALGLAGIQAKYGDAGGLKLLLFAFAFPLGVAVSLLGAALFGGTANSRAGRIGGLALLVVLAPILTPGIFGTQHSPNYFGYGGMSILTLVAAAMWFWGQYRMRLADAMRPAADWQGLGYLAIKTANEYQMSQTLGVLLVISVLAGGQYYALLWAERRLFRWMRQDELEFIT